MSLRDIDLRRYNNGPTFSPRTNNKLVCNQQPERGHLSSKQARSLAKETLETNRATVTHQPSVTFRRHAKPHKRPGKTARYERQMRAPRPTSTSYSYSSRW
jgi:hypothetical protein